MNAVSAQEQRGRDGDPATPKACPACGTRYPVDALFCATDGTPLQNAATSSGPDVDPYLGREIIGHIEIRQLAGIGAMGRVYRAFQKGIDRDVAVKILHRELSANQQLVARFHREAKVASRLAHSNVVNAYLTGLLPDGSMYIVMEYLDGLSLQSALAAVGGAMPLQRALHVGLQLCDAVGEAHAQGIVHRDIKPENVMLIRRGNDPDFVKVLDFGIARLNWGDQSMATAAGLIFGTARYISPEGAQGEQVAPSGDVYGIATLLYQMLAGRTPFEGESAVALLVQQIHDPPPPLRSIARASYVPEPIARVIMNNLGKNPSERAVDARVLGRALLDAAKASGLSADDLVGRAGLFGDRGDVPLQIASMQRTRQLQLDPQTAERIGAASSHRTSFEPPSTQLVPPGTAMTGAPGTATTRWVPPPGFDAKLVPPPPPSQGSPHFPPPRPSSVDTTIDDESTQPPPFARAAESATHRTAHRTSPSQPPGSPSQRPSHSTQIATPFVLAPDFDGAPGALEDSLGRRKVREILTTPAPTSAAPPSPMRPSKPPSSVDSTLGEGDDLKLPTQRGRAALIVFLCFLLGVSGATGIAYKLGFIGSAAPAPMSLNACVSKATDALLHQRWDAPPGENVRDITNEALTRFPNDPQVLHIREVACDEIVKVARKRKSDSDLTEALRLVKLAHELDPSDDDANTLARMYQMDVDEGSSIAPLGGADGALSPSGRAAIIATSFSATIDVSTASPRAGQQVELVAHIGTIPPGAARPNVSGATFVIAGTHVVANADESGVFRAPYTFNQPGKVTVEFQAKANAASVRASRTVTVVAAPAPPEPAQPLPPPQPPPSATATATASATESPALVPPQPSATSTAKWL